MSALATVRAELGVLLQTALPAWSVFPPQWATEDVRRPTLVLLRSSVERLRQAAPRGFALNTFSLWLVMPQGSGEDALDDRLDELLEVLDDGTDSHWTTAERDVFDETLPAYRITMTAHSQRS